MSALKRNKHGRFLKIKKEPDSEERAFHVQRLNLEEATPSPSNHSSTIIKSEPVSSDDSDYSPGKHVKTSLLAFKSQPEKKAKMAQSQLSSYFTPVKLGPAKDSLSQLSVFMTPVSEGSLGVKTPNQDSVIEISPTSTVSPGNKKAALTSEPPAKRKASKTKVKKSQNREEIAETENVKRTEDTEERAGKESSLFPDIKHQRGNLAYDRPVKIIGLREREGEVEYAVMFSPSFGKCLDAAIIPHQELVSRAPWLFASFILSDTTIS